MNIANQVKFKAVVPAHSTFALGRYSLRNLMTKLPLDLTDRQGGGISKL